MNEAESPKVRIDKWLWAARFFKTRNQATQAVSGGKVHVNGARIRPARPVAVNDVLTISKNEISYTIIVRGISAYRRPAVEAQQLYEETEESRENRRRAQETRKLLGASHSAPAKRPSKRDRRKIRAFIKKE